MDRDKSHPLTSLRAYRVAKKPAFNSEQNECRTTPYTAWRADGFNHIRIWSPSASWNCLITLDQDNRTLDNKHCFKNGIDGSEDCEQSKMHPGIKTGVCVGKRNTPATE
jgi:hypothetical protein